MLPIGIVSGIQGIRRISVQMRGREAHAGTTPRAMRSDALSASVDAIAQIEAAVIQQDPQDLLRFTVGALNVWPNSTNTIPGEVRFLIDLRHPSDAILTQTADLIARQVGESARSHRCEATVETVSHVEPTIFAPEIVAQLRACAAELGYGREILPSGAGHDAVHLAKICPTGMVFVRCAGGVSHHPSESALPSDLIAGARVAAAVALRAAQV
jgi:N-carbamoyl-L-amino-acid hydrolase